MPSPSKLSPEEKKRLYMKPKIALTEEEIYGKYPHAIRGTFRVEPTTSMHYVQIHCDTPGCSEVREVATPDLFKVRKCKKHVRETRLIIMRLRTIKRRALRKLLEEETYGSENWNTRVAEIERKFQEDWELAHRTLEAPPDKNSIVRKRNTEAIRNARKTTRNSEGG